MLGEPDEASFMEKEVQMRMKAGISGCVVECFKSDGIIIFEWLIKLLGIFYEHYGAK